MNRIELIKAGRVMIYAIEDAFMEDGYRILVDYEGKKKMPAVWTDMDGESDRVFFKKEDVEIALFKYMNNLLNLGVINKFIVL